LAIPVLSGWTMQDDFVELTIHGGSGDIANRQMCPGTEYVVGFEGRSGQWIDRISLICAPLLPGGGVGQAHTIDAAFGGNGGGPNSAKCRKGVMTGIKYWTVMAARFVWEIDGTCTDPVTHQLLDVARFQSAAGILLQTPTDTACPNGMAGIGLQGRWGQHVNAVGFICARLAKPPAPVASEQTPPRGPSRMLFCQGGNMGVSTGPLKLSIIIQFKAAPQSARAAIPARGECAWQDSPVGSNEPKEIYVPLKSEMKPIVETAQKGGIFLIHASVQGNSIQIDKIDSVNVGFVPGGG
jgi:hypothetical protein